MSTSPDRSKPPFPDEVAEQLGRHLQLTLVELIALSLCGKHLQWNAYGREFLGLHRHLDQVVGEWRALADVVAERAAAIGIAPDGSAGAVVELCDIGTLEPGFTEAGGASESLCAQLWEVAVRVRRRAELAGELDLVCRDVLLDVVRKLEEHLWLMRAQLAD
ncbi:MAG TPA: ferritin-like domain-containing protein [Baekduia sp.]|nr:ferritin-like domain-containing protein [Baekduia sp.]